jgi:hypothetical protein
MNAGLPAGFTARGLREVKEGGRVSAHMAGCVAPALQPVKAKHQAQPAQRGRQRRKARRDPPRRQPIGEQHGNDGQDEDKKLP